MSMTLATATLVAALVGLLADGYMYENSKNFNSSEAERSRQFNADEAEKVRVFNSAEAQKDRDWQEYMSSTSHQREVADLKAAGLNPILSVNSGAAVGSGAQAVQGFGGSSAQATNKPINMSNGINSAMSSALGAMQRKQEFEFKMSSTPPTRTGYTQNIYRDGKLVRKVDTDYRF